MQGTPDNFHNDVSKSTWSLLVEIPFSKSILDEDMPVGSFTGQFSDCLRDFDIPSETLCLCHTTLAAIARNAIEDNRAGRLNFPLTLRLFCQSKSLNPQPGNGAWGFYVIEKAGDAPGGLRHFSGRVVEFYFYRERKGG